MDEMVNYFSYYFRLDSLRETSLWRVDTNTDGTVYTFFGKTSDVGILSEKIETIYVSCLNYLVR